jgi:C1A family cysteine protease
MDDPDSKGVITYTGSKRGGHQYVLNGANKTTRTVRMKNSWGRGWGKSGFAYMSFDTLEAILATVGNSASRANC